MSKKAKKIPSGRRVCSWQGFLGEAAYEDAGCADGKIVDLDACEKPGGPCSVTGDECPNCGGEGHVANDHRDRGPMALIRERMRAEILEDLDGLNDEDAETRREMVRILTGKFNNVVDLIHKLENGHGTDAHH